MFNGSMAPSLSDIAAVTRNGDGEGFGGNNGWWVIILLLAIFGWGRGGYGNTGDGSGGVQSGYALATDFATLERKLDGVNNGLCDGFYAQNTNTLNGFASVQSTLCQGFSGINQAIVAQGYENRLGQNDISRQISDCCCTTQQNIKDVQTAMAMNTNALQQTMNNMSFQNQQAHCETLRAIHDVQDGIVNYLNAQKMQDLRDENFQYKLAASQEAQNNYLVNTLRPCPIPAYQSCNPWAAQANYGCACNSGCGC